MKKTLKILFLTLFVFSINSYAQADVKKEVKSTLSNIFDLCKNKSYDKAADLLAFEDGTRSFNYADKKEKKLVKRKCKKIKAYLDLSDSYEYVDVSANNGKTVANVNFISGDQKLKISFTFVKVGNKLLLFEFK